MQAEHTAAVAEVFRRAYGIDQMLRRVGRFPKEHQSVCGDEAEPGQGVTRICTSLWSWNPFKMQMSPRSDDSVQFEELEHQWRRLETRVSSQPSVFMGKMSSLCK